MSNIIDSMRHTVHYWKLSEFVLYSLPDGLYCASYILIMDAIWHREKGIVKNLIISIIPIITISSELFQYLGVVKGTFDIYDLMCYIVPPFIYIIMSRAIK